MPKGGFLPGPRWISNLLRLPVRLLRIVIVYPVLVVWNVISTNFFGKMGCNLCGPADQRFNNIVLLSISFMLVFTAFQTVGNIEKTVLDSESKEIPGFHGDGFVSLAIIYLSFSMCNWLAPSFVALVGAKKTLVLGSIVYTLFIAQFLYPNTYLLYAMSGVLGFGAAIIWTAQGNYLTLSSTSDTMARNSGVFWAILQCSMFFGNSFVMWQFDNQHGTIFDKRILIFSVLTGVSTVGVFMMTLLRPLSANQDGLVEPHGRHSSLDSFKQSISLLKDRNMLLLCLTFCYTGFELSFFSGVYGSAVGFTSAINDSKRLIGLIGILIGAGEILGGAAFGVLGSRTVRFGRDPIILLGFLSHIGAFYAIFLNLPNGSPQGTTTATGYLEEPNVGCLMLAAFLLGLGDACFNTQIYSIVGNMFAQKSAPAFAIFKFFQSSAAAVSFVYSTMLPLDIQLAILVITCFIGTLSFFVVEWRDRSRFRTIPSVLRNEALDDADPIIPTNEDDAMDT